MRDAFDAAFDYLLESEGRDYVNRPNDSGGPTKFGITIRAYSSYMDRYVLPAEIKALTLDQAKPFYLVRYWSPLGCDAIISPEISIALLDSGVLYGVGTAALLIQRSLNSLGIDVTVDGSIGRKTIAAINSAKPRDLLVAFHTRLLDRIDAVVRTSPKNQDFRAGWTNRANRLLTLGGVTPPNGVCP